MDIIPKHTFAIVSEGSKLKELNKIYNETQINFIPWIKENKKMNITEKCQKYCSINMVNNWEQHYSLWEHIYTHKYPTTLIVEENTFPINNFVEKLVDFWMEIPNDWDIIFLGCEGTCNSSVFNKLFYRLFFNKVNKIDNNYIKKPSYPNGLYGYIISYRGIKKIIKDHSFTKISFHLDSHLNTKKLNVYSPKNPLIRLSHNNIIHSIFFDIVNPQYEREIIFIKSINTSITYYTIFIAVIVIILSLLKIMNKSNAIIPVLIAITILHISEICFTKGNNTKYNTLLIELFLIYIIYYFIFVLAHNQLF